MIISVEWKEDIYGESSFKDYTVDYKWNDHRKQQSKIGLHPGVASTLYYFIKQCSVRNDSTYLTGYIRFSTIPQQCTENVTFHATESKW